MGCTNTHIGSISVACKERLDKLLASCYELVDLYSLLSSSGQKLCTAEYDWVQCDTFVLGSIIRRLRSLRLFPGPVEAASMKAYSVKEFAKSLCALECAVYPENTGRYSMVGHERCYTIALRIKVDAQIKATAPSLWSTRCSPQAYRGASQEIGGSCSVETWSTCLWARITSIHVKITLED